jgi:hypothetical protein
VTAGILKKHGGRRKKSKSCGKTWSLEKNCTKKLKASAEGWILDRSTLRRIRDKKHWESEKQQEQNKADNCTLCVLCVLCFWILLVYLCRLWILARVTPHTCFTFLITVLLSISHSSLFPADCHVACISFSYYCDPINKSLDFVLAYRRAPRNDNKGCEGLLARGLRYY